MDFPGGTSVKICLPMSRMQKTEERRVQSLGQKDPREEEMAMHSSILGWKIPWSEEPGWLHSWSRKEEDTTEQLSTHTCVSVLLCSVAQSCLTLWNPTDCSTPGFPVLHHLLEPAQTHVHWVNNAIQPPNPLSSPSPPALNLSQHQGLFQWAGSLHQVVRVLELQLQHQSFQWIFKIGFL